MSRIYGIPSDEKRDEKAGGFWANLAGKLGLKREMTKKASAAPSVERLSDAIQTYGSRPRPTIASSNLDRPGRSVPVEAHDASFSTHAQAAQRAAGVEARVAAAIPPAAKGVAIGSTEEFVKARYASVKASRRAKAIGGLHLKTASELSDLLSRIEQIETSEAPQYRSVLDQIMSGAESYVKSLEGPAQAPATMGPFDSIAPSGPMPAMASAEGAYNRLSFAKTLAEFLAAQGAPKRVAAASVRPDTLIKKASAALRGLVSKFAGTGDPGDAEVGNTVYKDLNKCRDCVWFESDWTHETYRDKCKHCIHARLGGTVDHYWPRSAQMNIWMPQWANPQAEKSAFHGSLSSREVRAGGSLPKSIAEAVVEDAAKSGGLNARTLSASFAKPFSGNGAAHLAALGGRVARLVVEATGIEFLIDAAKAKAWGWKTALKDGEVVLAYPKNLQETMAEDASKEVSVNPAKEGEAAAKMENEHMAGKHSSGKVDRCPMCQTKAATKSNAYCRDCGKHLADDVRDGNPKGALCRCWDCKVAFEDKMDKEAGLSAFAKGERAKIRSLRQRLEAADDPAEIKSLSDAIDALETRMEKDKERREKRKEEREEKQKAKAEEAKEPVAASFRGTLRLAQDAEHLKEDSEDFKEIRRHNEGIKHELDELESKDEAVTASFSGTLSLAGCKERENKKPKDYGNAKPPKPLKALAAKDMWVVTKASGQSELGDILFKADGRRLELQFAGGLKGNEIVGFFEDESEAKAAAEAELGRQGSTDRAAAVDIGQTYVNKDGLQIKVTAEGMGEVVESKNPAFATGEKVRLDPSFATEFQKPTPKAAGVQRKATGIFQGQTGYCFKCQKKRPVWSYMHTTRPEGDIRHYCEECFPPTGDEGEIGFDPNKPQYGPEALAEMKREREQRGRTAGLAGTLSLAQARREL